MLVTFRSTAQPLTGLFPAALIVGRQMQVPSNFLCHSVTQLKQINKVTFDIKVVQQHIEQKQQKMTKQFNIRHRVCKPKVSIGQRVRVRLQVRHKKTCRPYIQRTSSCSQLCGPIYHHVRQWQEMVAYCFNIRPCDPPKDDDVHDGI